MSSQKEYLLDRVKTAHYIARPEPDGELNGVQYLREVPEGWNIYGCDLPHPEWRYTQGQCHALALAMLEERPSWTLACVMSGGHFAVITDDGDLLDVRDMGQDFAWDVDVEGEDAWEVLREYVKHTIYALPVLDEDTREVARRRIAWYEDGDL